MSGEREYHFRGLDNSENQGGPGQQEFKSSLSCCGVNLWDLSCGAGHCQCSAGSCEAQFSRTPGEGSRGIPYRRIVIGMANCLALALFVYLVIYCVGIVQGDTYKYKVCVVDGRGGFKRTSKYCPKLDNITDSKVECVIGLDSNECMESTGKIPDMSLSFYNEKLDCLRRIAKGKADFSVFTAEDLIAANNAQMEVLITNELQFAPSSKFEFEVVAIVNNNAGINSKHDLKEKKLCHPGYGYDVHWTNVIANYLEASVVPRSCMVNLTLTENRIKASSEYFRAACKAGAWDSDSMRDAELKRKYPNLCALCSNPRRCSMNDKYWGRRGSLYCLTDGVGDVSWARLEDAQAHFGITLEPDADAFSPEGYSFLCQDGSKRPVNTTNPCIWVSRPWDVIAAKRTSAQEIQRLVNHLEGHAEDTWQDDVVNLIENIPVALTPVDPIQAIESYLINTPGFQSANSFTGCHPPRSIRICTTSILENAKCKWMGETASVYGIEPDFQCLKADNKTHCLQAISLELADVVLLPPDLIMTAKRDYNMKTLLYEEIKPEDRYETVAVVRKDSTIRKYEDLRGKKACFPSYEGIAWNSMLYDFHRRGLLSSGCPYSLKVANFFGETCAPGVPDSAPKSSYLKKLCASNQKQDDFGALKCLVNEKADVAFVSKSTLKNLWAGGQQSHDKVLSSITSDKIRMLCPDASKQCHLSWWTKGEIMIRSSASDMAFHETFDAFMRMDKMFGADYTSINRPFSMYGPYDGEKDVLFHDDTIKFRDIHYFRRLEESVPSYDDILEAVSECVEAAGNSARPSVITGLFFIVFMFSLR